MPVCAPVVEHGVVAAASDTPSTIVVEPLAVEPVAVAASDAVADLAAVVIAETGVDDTDVAMTRDLSVGVVPSPEKRSRVDLVE